MAVRLNADWMGLVDERILEWLDTHGPASPGKITESDEMQFSRDYINKRLILINKADLVQGIGNGVYQITPKGRSYLSGDADLRDEEKPE